MVWAKLLPLTATELPEALKRGTTKPRSRENKRVYGKSVSKRPVIVDQHIEKGYWENDIVIGKRKGQEAVILSLLEKKTENYLAIRIRNNSSETVLRAMQALRAEYGDLFSQVFKSITVDNGSEFSDFAKVEVWCTDVYYAHPYSP